MKGFPTALLLSLLSLLGGFTHPTPPVITDILKSMGIRQHIADIVEGGKDAFIIKEERYRFH